MINFSSLTEDARIAARSLADFAGDMIEPTVRLGVTGLSRAGKTVFITALIHNLIHGGRLPLFSAFAEGRLARANLQPQPDDAVPRFDYEKHVRNLSGDDRHWPDSTRQISEISIAIEYESAGFFSRNLGRGRLRLDIVDYPGEWILDLPLLGQSYRDWSRETIELSRTSTRAPLAEQWQAYSTGLDPRATADESVAREAAALFTAYLRACRDERVSLSMLPPGRFLMPGDLEGSPALTFAPLDVPADESAPRDSLWAMMERRYEAYRTVVVRPFFRDHFARLDRQIVLVDLLSALNAGPAALTDLAGAIEDILTAFRPGANSLLTSLFRPRIERVLLAATKADHLHHVSHDQLEAVLARLAGQAISRARDRGADVEVLALASIRATREAQVAHGAQRLNAIVGTPESGERLDGQIFSGSDEIALFPGDLPANVASLFDSAVERPFRGLEQGESGDGDFRFLRLRPPGLVPNSDGTALTLPHIRLDKALEFLVGDYLA